jgi:hypothetical protein
MTVSGPNLKSNRVLTCCPLPSPAHSECDCESEKRHRFSTLDGLTEFILSPAEGLIIGFGFPIAGVRSKSPALFIHFASSPQSEIVNSRLPLRVSSLLHRVTRSALAKTFGGIVRPICLALSD